VLTFPKLGAITRFEHQNLTQRAVSASVRGDILKYLHTLIAFTVLFYMQFTFNTINVQTYGLATEFWVFVKKNPTRLFSRKTSFRERVHAHQGTGKKEKQQTNKKNNPNVFTPKFLQ